LSFYTSGENYPPRVLQTTNILIDISVIELLQPLDLLMNVNSQRCLPCIMPLRHDPLHNFHFLHTPKMIRFSLGDICIMKRRSTFNNGTFRSAQSPYLTCCFQYPLWLNTSNIQALFSHAIHKNAHHSYKLYKFKRTNTHKTN
jgi:hypothetical protein